MTLQRRSTGFFYFLVLICCANVVKSLDHCGKSVYIIRSTDPTALVLDGTQPVDVLVQPFTGFSTQLWRLDPGDTPGSFYIVNLYHEKALHFYDEHRPDENLYSLVMRDKTSSVEQQWYFTARGRITNVANQANIDILYSNFTAGNRVVVFGENGCPCQEFVFVKKV